MIKYKDAILIFETLIAVAVFIHNMHVCVLMLQHNSNPCLIPDCESTSEILRYVQYMYGLDLKSLGIITCGMHLMHV